MAGFGTVFAGLEVVLIIFVIGIGYVFFSIIKWLFGQREKERAKDKRVVVQENEKDKIGYNK